LVDSRPGTKRGGLQPGADWPAASSPRLDRRCALGPSWGVIRYSGARRHVRIAAASLPVRRPKVFRACNLALCKSEGGDGSAAFRQHRAPDFLHSAAADLGISALLRELARTLGLRWLVRRSFGPRSRCRGLLRVVPALGTRRQTPLKEGEAGARNQRTVTLSVAGLYRAADECDLLATNQYGTAVPNCLDTNVFRASRRLLS
jgi:hypothetical protein